MSLGLLCALRYGVALVIWGLFVAFLWGGLRRRCPLPELVELETPSRPDWGWVLALALLLVAAYGSLVCCLSSAYFGGDDFGAVWAYYSPWLERLRLMGGSYLKWVSRSGELLRLGLGLAESSWQHVLLTPLMICLAPWGMARLVAPRSFRLASPAGLCLTLVVLLLCVVGVGTQPWTNVIDFSAAVNYLWPSVLLFFFLSFYRPAYARAHAGTARVLGVALLGLWCGWALECMVFIAGFLTLWLIWCAWRRMPVARSCWWGLAGYGLGMVMLLASPALDIREAKCMVVHEPALVSQYIERFLAGEVWTFSDGTGRIMIGSVPLMKRVLFLPFWWGRFWACCHVGLLSFVGLSLAYAAGLWRAPQRSWSVLLVALSLAVYGCFSALSYTVKLVPDGMSFLPGCYAVAAACCVLFVRLRWLWLQALLSLGLLAYALMVVVPPVREAWAYKPYEQARSAQLQQQLEAGVEDVVLSYPYPVEPQDKMGLIRRGWISPHNDVFRVMVYRAQGYPIKSLRQEPKEADNR